MTNTTLRARAKSIILTMVKLYNGHAYFSDMARIVEDVINSNDKETYAKDEAAEMLQQIESKICNFFDNGCSTIDPDDYILIPVRSEQMNEDGTYDIISYRREYVG